MYDTSDEIYNKTQTTQVTVDVSSIDDHIIDVRFEVGGKILEIDKVNRLARRLLEGQANKFRKKYADMIGPNGERPTIVIRAPRLFDKNIEIILEYPESMKSHINGHEKAIRIS